MIITGMDNLVDKQNLNETEIKNLVPGKCTLCSVPTMNKTNSKCEDCPFTISSDRGRVGCSAIFKQFGIIEPSQYGKHHLFFFIFYHPEFDYKWPAIPEYDIFGQTQNDKQLRWEIHHINTIHSDDRKQNLLLCLNTEHGWVQNLSKKIKDTRKIIMIIKHRNKLLGF